jgi:hypothetical protein
MNISNILSKDKKIIFLQLIILLILESKEEILKIRKLTSYNFVPDSTDLIIIF